MLAEQPNSGNETYAVSDSYGPVMSPAAATVQATPAERFFDAIGTSLAINTSDEFRAWAQSDLQQIFPHGTLACGVGMVENSGGDIQPIITCNLPDAYLQSLRQKGGLGRSPIFAQWAQSRRPVLFETTEQDPQSPWLEDIQRYGLRNLAAHGMCEFNSRATSYFSFSQIPGKLTSRHAQLLEMLVPHLHVALTRVIRGVKNGSRMAKSMSCLTERESEILNWLGSGKTNWEIAQVLRISENTVKNHVQRILTKLKVTTRAQAVAQVSSPDNCITCTPPFSFIVASSKSRLRLLAPLLLACLCLQDWADVVMMV